MNGGAVVPALFMAKNEPTHVFVSVCWSAKSAAEMGQDTLLDPHLTVMSMVWSQAMESRQFRREVMTSLATYDMCNSLASDRFREYYWVSQRILPARYWRACRPLWCQCRLPSMHRSQKGERWTVR